MCVFVHNYLLYKRVSKVRGGRECRGVPLTTGQQGFGLLKNDSPGVRGSTSRVRAKLLGLNKVFIDSKVNLDTQFLGGGLISDTIFFLFYKAGIFQKSCLMINKHIQNVEIMKIRKNKIKF